MFENGGNWEISSQATKELVEGPTTRAYIPDRKKAPRAPNISMKNAPGIYSITNAKNGKVYVGSSMDVSRRLSQHRWALKRGDHKNHHLMAAWNKYGKDAFTFACLEECDAASLLSREQWWIEHLKSASIRGYNLAHAQRSDYPSEKTSKRVKARFEGRSLDERRGLTSQLVNPIVRAENSERMTARWQDPEFRQKRLEGLSRGRDKINSRKDPRALETLAKGRAKAIERSRTDPERKAKQREICRAMWADPDTRAKMIANLNAGREKINARKKANAQSKRAGNDIV